MKKNALLVSAIIIGLAAVTLLSRTIDARHANNSRQFGEEPLYVSAPTAKRLSLGFKGLTSDWYWMRSLQYVGGKAVRADFEKFFSSAKNVKGDFVSLRVVADGKVGVAYSIQHFTWMDKDGKPGEGTFRVTDGWHKVKGQWKLFHTHVSFPLNPESGKAEMNLKE